MAGPACVGVIDGPTGKSSIEPAAARSAIACADGQPEQDADRLAGLLGHLERKRRRRPTLVRRDRPHRHDQPSPVRGGFGFLARDRSAAKEPTERNGYAATDQDRPGPVETGEVVDRDADRNDDDDVLKGSEQCLAHWGLLSVTMVGEPPGRAHVQTGHVQPVTGSRTCRDAHVLRQRPTPLRRLRDPRCPIPKSYELALGRPNSAAAVAWRWFSCAGVGHQLDSKWAVSQPARRAPAS